MRSRFPRYPFRTKRFVAIALALLLSAMPLLAQQPAPAVRQQTPQGGERTLDGLLAADAYKLYGEVRNVGQLLSNGGAGEIVDPIIKLADPGKEFKSIISFLKKNSESLSSSRLVFATWRARTDVPTVFVAIEFPTSEDAVKFVPKLETFLPTVLPPVAVPADATPEAKSSPAISPAASSPPPTASPIVAASPPPAERLPFVVTQNGNLVFISDKTFKFEKLHPRAGRSLFQDQNFRIAQDKFSSEPLFFYFNLELEDRTIPKPSPTPVITEVERAQMQREREAEILREQEEARAAMEAENDRRQSESIARGNPEQVVISAEVLPTPTPTKEQEVQQIASNQIGGLLDAIGYGQAQMPDAVGLAVALEGNEYVLRALLIDKPEAKRLPIPFIPQLVSGPPYAAEAASVLPDDTDIFVTASIDLTQTYEGMRKAAEQKAKADAEGNWQVYRDGVLTDEGYRGKEPEPDAFTQFEKKAGFKIKEELIAALGNEIALASSLKTLQGIGGFNLGLQTSSSGPPNAAAATKDGEKKPEQKFPILLIEVKDRDAVRRLMPHVLDGLGIGEANLLAQSERREDTEMVNYAGMFAYAFVGNFLVISDAVGVRCLIDANLNHQTLSSNSVFHNSRRWQTGRTLGQVYVSPALMQSYHDEIRKEAGTMDQAMRDFLLSLDPRTEAITYALSNDGLGTQHEVHLPRNLILTMVAGISAAAKNPPPEANEMVAINILRTISSAEQAYQSTTGKGQFGTLDQLAAQHLLSTDMFDRYGYAFEVAASGNQFEATATPREYGKTGNRSFFVDKSGVVRGDDHGGGPATIADKPVE